jgi:tetratricopeptide (TPR) repeat protein
MEHRTKRDILLINLVSEFEDMFEKGTTSYLEEKEFYQLIEYYESEYQLDKALDVVDLAIEQFEYRVEFYLIKVRLLLQDQNPKKAYEIIQKAELISPMENEVLILKARVFNNLGKYEEAFEIIESLKVKGSKFEMSEVYLCESYLHENMKRYDEMFNSLKNSLRIDPNNFEALERIWSSVELSRMYESSIQFHQELLDRNPYSFLVWYNLGHAYSFLGEYEDAIDALEYSFLINKNFEIGYLDCAELCVQLKDYKRALSIYEDAYTIFGPDSELLVLIAECHINLGNLLSAKAHLFTALRLDPYNDEVYYYLGKCYAKEESFHHAINAFKKAIQIEKDNEAYYSDLGLAYLRVGNYKQAKFNFKRATRIAPEEGIYWYQYVSLLIKLKELDKALKVLDTSDEFTVASELLYCRAVCLSNLGRKSEALEVLDEALIDDFSMHQYLFELDPQLRFDKDILSIINYYKPEEEEI